MKKKIQPISWREIHEEFLRRKTLCNNEGYQFKCVFRAYNEEHWIVIKNGINVLPGGCFNYEGEAIAYCYYTILGLQ